MSTCSSSRSSVPRKRVQPSSSVCLHASLLAPAHSTFLRYAPALPRSASHAPLYTLPAPAYHALICPLFEPPSCGKEAS